MPYLNDFEADNPLQGWDYNPEAWRVITEGGNRHLQGRSGLANPLEVLGNEVPEWLSGSGDLVISFRLNLNDPNSVARMLFSFSSQGYYVLEVFSGTVSIRRGTAGQHIERAPERIVRSLSAPIQSGSWYEFMVWVEGARIYVYVNNALLLSIDDSSAGALPPGAILFQSLTQSQGINIDDLKVERPLEASDHFQGSEFPPTWTRSDSFNVTMQAESGNQFARLQNNTVARPNTPPLDNFQMAVRLLNLQGGMEIRLRESDQGAYVLAMDGGNLTVRVTGSTGQVLYERLLTNFYGRGNWFDLIVRLVDDRLFLFKNGQLIHEEAYPGGPVEGGITFAARNVDIFQIDDFLVTTIARSPAEDARFALEILVELQQRPIRELLNEWTEDFSDALRTDWWWEGGIPGPGQYVNDPNQTEHRSYYSMTYLGTPTWRRLRPQISEDLTVFGEGTDHTTYRDSSDFYARVLIRFPEGQAGTAWMGVRAVPTITGTNLDGFRYDLTRNTDGTYTIAVRYSDPGTQELLYEGEAPRPDTGVYPVWMELVVVAFHDRIAFFCNGKLVKVVLDVQWLGGTVALGVEPGTTAHFDDLLIRDTSPRGF